MDYINLNMSNDLNYVTDKELTLLDKTDKFLNFLRPKCVNYLCPGEDIRRYVAGPPGPPGAPGPPGSGASGHGGYTFNTQEVAERVLTLMNGE